MPDHRTPEAYLQLLDIMATLRSDQGCRWDRRQTPDSLKPYLLEECYELLEAIDRGHPQEICDELGDLLLQVVFLAQMFSERDLFAMEEVAASISNKLIRRHPHIFARADEDGHEQRWEAIKLQERRERGQALNLAARIPKSLPALKQAQKIAKRLAAKASSDVIVDIEDELKHLVLPDDAEPDRANRRSQIFAALLFNLARLGNTYGIDAEDTLRQFNLSLVREIDAQK